MSKRVILALVTFVLVAAACLGTSAASPSPTPYRRFCACGCSSIPDCNTDADCSNHRCLPAISCC